ncbi:hypothetical protein [Lachnoclostridium phytofermentans]|uniref:Uncharacterized protein n=1 Tax=Lachnoclostridium phytofermentans (strain ATCC 700394 / DSM 18823 / ISDg) TaxID=357809 RepID=A9KJV5_LACP7|nr:hypothetical protein [Lachnoclostridium phytofermentans]ABX41110.1 hypothetical protein Cphy_0723 [Lachnoclostridium phytofermentans ISDg]
MRKNQKLYITIAAFALTTILVATTAMHLSKSPKKEQDNQSQELSTSISENRSQEDQAIDSYTEHEPTQVPEENTFLKINTDKEIDDLIKKYYQSQLNVDKKLYESISVDANTMDVNVTARKVEYVESYDNIIIHVAKGNEAIDLVAYVEYDLHINSIDTCAPSIDRFFIKYINGEPKLYFDKLYPKTAEYFNTVNENEEVQKLIKTVNDKFSAALKADEKLNDFYKSVTEETVILQKKQ